MRLFKKDRRRAIRLHGDRRQLWTHRALHDAIEALDAGDALQAERHLVAALAQAESECPQARFNILKSLNAVRR